MKVQKRIPTEIKTILLVDDLQDNLIVMKTVLQNALPDVEVATFQNPEEVMDYLRTANVTLVILDVQMPGISGIDLCRMIKASDATRHIAVILVTSHVADSSLKAEGLNAGADIFLIRPIDNDELVAQVQVALRIKQAEAQMLRTVDLVQQDYRQLFDKMVAGIAVNEMVFGDKGKPLGYRFLAVNPAFETLVKLHAEEIVGKTAREVFPGLSPEWMERYEQVMATGKSVHFEDFISSLDQYVEVTAFRTGKNQFATSFTDITERRHTEIALAESEKKMLTWLEYSPACTKILDLDFNLQYMSAAGVKGLKVDDVTQLYGKPYPFAFFPESYSKKMLSKLTEAKVSGETVTFEGAVVDVEGTEIWFHATIVPVKNDKNKLQYLMVISINTTAHKQAEVEMDRQLDELRRWHTATLGRENRVCELKNEVNALAIRLGETPPYRQTESSEQKVKP